MTERQLKEKRVERNDGWGVGLVELGLLVIASLGWLRLWRSIVDWYWLDYAGISPGPLYLAITGALWGILGLLGYVALKLRRKWSRTAAFGVGLLIVITYWIDRLLVSGVEITAENSGFMVLVSVIGLVYALIVLKPAANLRQGKVDAGEGVDKNRPGPWGKANT